MVIVHRSFRAAPSVERCRSTSLPANGTAHRGRLVQRSQGSRRTRQAVSRETSAPTGPHSCAALESDPRCFTWNTLAGRAVPLTVRFHDPGGPRSSSPRSASTWPSSQHQRTSCRGRSCHPKPSSPGRAPKPTRPAKGTATSKVSSAKSPPLPPEPTRSSENATDASCADEASNEPTPARQRRLIDNSEPWDSTSPSHPQQPDNPLAPGTSGSRPTTGAPPRTTTGQPRATPRNSQLRRLAASRGCRLDAGSSKGRDLPARRRRSGTEPGRSPPDGGQRWPDRPGATDPPTRPAHR